MPKPIYTYDFLQKYIIDNDITLIIDYSTYERINKNTTISGNCKTSECSDIFNKKFLQLTISGAYCQQCTINNTFKKITEKSRTYTYQRLFEHCSENSIELLKDYSDKLLNIEYMIEGKCKTETCENNFNKSFKLLLRIGPYCYNCSKENGKTKIKNTNMERYGVECAMKCDKIKEKSINAIIEKYGTDNYFKTEEFKQKSKKTCLQKYGVEFSMQNESIRNKSKETNVQRYGEDNYFKTKEFKEKCEETNIEKYGVEHPFQNSEFAEKIYKNSFKLKEYTLPSGKIIKYQGYEHFAYNELLNIQNLDENELITSRKEVPEVWYEDENGKRHRYYVDIFIPSQNKCIEVKSTWTMRKPEFVFEKQRAVKELGYECEIWVYDKDGTLIEKHI